jgi:hypothetical protein
MSLLGALEHGIYVEKEVTDDSDDECHGMSIAQIHQHFGLDKVGCEGEMSVEEEEQCQAEKVVDEDSMPDDDSEDWLVCPSEGHSEDERLEELDGLNVACLLSFLKSMLNKPF